MAWFQKPKADYVQIAFNLVEIVKRNQLECENNMQRIAHDFRMTADDGWESRVPVACLMGSWTIMLDVHKDKARDLMPYLRSEADRRMDGQGDAFIDNTTRMYETFADEWGFWSVEEFKKHTMKTMVAYVFGRQNMPKFAPTMPTFAANMFHPVLGEARVYLESRRIQ